MHTDVKRPEVSSYLQGSWVQAETKISSISKPQSKSECGEEEGEEVCVCVCVHVLLFHVIHVHEQSRA